MAVIQGNNSSEVLTGTSSNDTISGAGGDDELYGRGGDDLLDGGSGNDFLDGGSGDDDLIGGLGFNDLRGGSGLDLFVMSQRTLSGFSDDLIYDFTFDEDRIDLSAWGVSDFTQITALLTYDFTGSATLNAFYGGFDHVLTLDGIWPGELIASDFVFADPAALNASGTADDDVMFGSRNGDVLQGLAGSDILLGGLGDDQLFGGAGADVMIGGVGNDIFVADALADRAIEAAGEGNDVVYALADHALTAGSSIERLSAIDWSQTVALNLTGNGFANLIEGNAGANVINGGGGADTMYGFGGNDIYVVDHAADVVNEAAGQGNDVVYALVDYTLGAGSSVERLSAIDWSQTGALKLTGNEFGQTVEGNAGANVLNGAGGADRLAGFAGNDVYIVDNAGDQVMESAGQGNDVVYALADFTLGAGSSVERLSAIDWSQMGALNLTGNEFANAVEGNAGANVLNGGAGNDVLVGFGGADSFAFTTALGSGNVDTIADFVSGTDRILLDDAVFAGIGSPGPLNPNAFFAGTAAHDADDRIIYDQATGKLFFDADGNGAGAAVLFATLMTQPMITAADFTVI